MNALIHLSQSPVSVAPESLSSSSRVHVSLSQGSLSLFQWCKRSHLVSRPLNVKCTLDRFSEGPKMKEEENGKKNIVRGVGRASLALACVLGAFTLSGKMMNPKPNIAYAGCQDRSRGSVTCLEKSFFKTERPNASEIKALKLWAMALSMKEECGDVAERIMSDECERFKETPTSDPLSVSLIELLLDQKKYSKAKQKIQELLREIKKKGGMADVPEEKIYLLKAIAESESDEPKKAKRSWKRYQDELSSSPSAVIKKPRGEELSGSKRKGNEPTV